MKYQIILEGTGAYENETQYYISMLNIKIAVILHVWLIIFHMNAMHAHTPGYYMMFGF